MAGGDEGHRPAQLALQLRLPGLSCRVHLLVIGLDGGLHGLLLVLGALPGLALQHIARADKGHGTHNAARFSVATALGQHDQVIRRLADIANHRGAQKGQQGAAFAQRGDGIVIAAEQQQRHPGAVQLHHQVVVELAGIAGGRPGVENIAGNEDGIHRMRFNLKQQPVDQGLMLCLAAFAHEVLAEVPV